MNQHEITDGSSSPIVFERNQPSSAASRLEGARKERVRTAKKTTNTIVGVALAKTDSSSTHVGYLARFVAILLYLANPGAASTRNLSVWCDGRSQKNTRSKGFMN